MKKIALITGSATRIGRKIALHLSKNGWQIVIHCNHSISEANQLCAEISNISHSIVVQQDLKITKNFDLMFEGIIAKIGTPTLLINNAAVFKRDDTNIDIDALTEHINVNCFAPILLSEKFIKSSTKPKNIINIIDSFTNTPTANFISYNISKTAMLYATKCLALKFKQTCRVNSISPGMLLEPRNDDTKDLFDTLVKNLPSKKKEKIQDLLSAIDLILSTDSMTGNDIIIDSRKSCNPV